MRGVGGSGVRALGGGGGVRFCVHKQTSTYAILLLFHFILLSSSFSLFFCHFRLILFFKKLCQEKANVILHFSFSVINH